MVLLIVFLLVGPVYGERLLADIEQTVRQEIDALNPSASEELIEPDANSCAFESNVFWNSILNQLPDGASLGEFKKDARYQLDLQLRSVSNSLGKPDEWVFGSGIEANPKAQEFLHRANIDQFLSYNYHSKSDQGVLSRAVSARLYCHLMDSNEEYLYEYVEREGFPAEADLGKEGAHAGRLLVKHFTDRERFMEIKAAADKAFKKERISGVNYGNFLDFAHQMEHGTQILGTYRTCRDGKPIYYPALESESQADELRAKLGFGLTVSQALESYGARFCGAADN